MTKLVKRTRIWGGYKLAVLLAVAMAGSAVFGGQWYHIPGGGKVGYWDDTNCWWTSSSYNAHVAKPSTDTHTTDAGATIYVTNDVASLWGTPISSQLTALWRQAPPRSMSRTEELSRSLFWIQAIMQIRAVQS